MRSAYYKTSYWSDRELLPLTIDRMAIVIAALAAAAVPFLPNTYLIHLINLTTISIVGALGLNLLMGVCGQISLGHAAFIATGAYATAILTDWLPWVPFPLVFIFAGLVSAVLGILAALPAFRLKGLYLALATIAVYHVVLFVLLKADGLTGGAIGLKVAAPSLIGDFRLSELSFYPIGLATAVLCVLICMNLMRTKVGRAWKAVRDYDLVAAAMGINLRYYKALAFASSSFLAGVAGSMYAFYIGFISPADFSFGMTISYIAMVIVGGMGVTAGAVSGAILITWLPFIINLMVGYSKDFLPGLQVATILPYMESISFGLVIVFFLVFEPDGLFGIWVRFRKYLVLWPFKH